jgi:hypothetical protein
MRLPMSPYLFHDTQTWRVLRLRWVRRFGL